MPKLASHRYGKARVRVAKILRSKDRQSIVEIDVAAMLEGDFESSYTAGDNTKVVPTDTIKNTINILAKEKLGEEIEPFAIALGEHFLKHYQQVRSASIEVSARDWRRIEERSGTAECRRRGRCGAATIGCIRKIGPPRNRRTASGHHRSAGRRAVRRSEFRTDPAMRGRRLRSVVRRSLTVRRPPLVLDGDLRQPRESKDFSRPTRPSEVNP